MHIYILETACSLREHSVSQAFQKQIEYFHLLAQPLHQSAPQRAGLPPGRLADRPAVIRPPTACPPSVWLAGRPLATLHNLHCWLLNFLNAHLADPVLFRFW